MSPRPIFIIGSPRSGTSVMTWSLGQHPNIQPMPETAWIASMAIGSFAAFRKGSEREKFSHLSNVQFPLDLFLPHIGSAIHDIVLEVYEERCRQIYGDDYQEKGIRLNPANPNFGYQVRRRVEDPKARWVDGTPLNSLYLWGLKLLFPEARFIHNLRSPDEVALSLVHFENVGGASQAIEQGLETWRSHAEPAWLAEKAWGPEVVFRLDYHRLDEDRENLFQDLLEFLDEDHAAECLLPLARKTNSSEVDEHREAGLEEIRTAPSFAPALELYQRMQFDLEPDETAERALRSQFDSHLQDADLLDLPPSPSSLVGRGGRFLRRLLP